MPADGTLHLTIGLSSHVVMAVKFQFPIRSFTEYSPVTTYTANLSSNPREDTNISTLQILYLKFIFVKVVHSSKSFKEKEKYSFKVGHIYIIYMYDVQCSHVSMFLSDSIDFILVIFVTNYKFYAK